MTTLTDQQKAWLELADRHECSDLENTSYLFSESSLLAFCSAIAALEREECARLCEAEAVDAEASDDVQSDTAYNLALTHAAQAIRSRKEEA